MRYSSAALMAGLAAQQASATFWDVSAPYFSSPDNTDNKCSSQQHGGYDFGDLEFGAELGAYLGASWSGFSCQKSASLSLKERTLGDLGGNIAAGLDISASLGYGFGASAGVGVGVSVGGGYSSSGKCIAGSVGGESGPSFSCSSENSVSGFQISADIEAELEAWYYMPAGHVCKQPLKCGKQPYDYPNKQCGGATSVSFVWPSATASKSCSMSIHSITWDCSTASTTRTYSTPAKTTTPVTTTASTTAATTTPAVYTTSASTAPATSTTTSAVSTTLSTYSTRATTSTTTTGVPVTTSSLSSYTSPATSASTNGTTLSSVVVSTLSSYAPSTPGQQFPTTSSAVSSSSSKMGTTSASSMSSSVVTSSMTTTSSTPSSPAECPGLVPKCLNTWLWESGCKDNTDSACYCKSSKFIAHVMECISCNGADCNEKSKAASYLVGICGAFITSNPALVTAIPSCATIAPTYAPTGTPVTLTTTITQAITITSCAPTVTNCPASSTVVTTTVVTTGAPTGSATGGNTVPATTIPYTSIYTVPAVYTTGASAGQTIPGSTITTTIQTTLTVPQVSFAPAPAASGTAGSTGLYQPTPAPVSATVTGTGIYTTSRPSASSPVPFTGGAGKNGLSFAVAAIGVVALLV